MVARAGRQPAIAHCKEFAAAPGFGMDMADLCLVTVAHNPDLPGDNNASVHAPSSCCFDNDLIVRQYPNRDVVE